MEIPGSGRRSEEHGVTVAEKTVALRDRMGVRREQRVPSREGAAQHQQRRFGEMKIRQQGIDGAKLIARLDEQAGDAPVGRNHAAASGRRSRGFQAPDHRRADGDHPPAGGARGIDRRGGAVRHLHPLLVHHMVFEIVRPHRLEGARADVQRDERPRDAARLELGEGPLVEVQARGGRRHRAGFARIDRLIALPVGAVRRPIDIGGQRHLAVRLEVGQHVAGELEPVQVSLATLHARFGAAGQKDPGAGPQSLAGAGVDQCRGGVERPFEQQFDFPAAVLDAVNPRRHHPGVVEHEKILSIDQLRKIAELPVLDAAARAVEHHQSAAGALRGRPLGDEFSR